MFISARVDRWGAAARLLIGAQYPHQCLTHTSIPPPLRRSCSIPAAPLALRRHPSLLHLLFLLSLPLSLFLFHRASLLRRRPPSAPHLSLLFFLTSFLLVLSSFLPPFRPLSVVIFVLSVSPQLSAFLSFPPPSSGPIRPRAVLRFSPCRPIIRSLFTLIFSFVSRPHTREPRNLYYSLARIRSPPFPLVFRTPTLTSSTLFLLSLPLLLLLAFPVAPIKAAVSKPVALSRTRARSRFFPMRGFFFRCYCRLSDASHSPGFPLSFFLSLSSLSLPSLASRHSRNGNFNTLISIGKFDECYLYIDIV